MPRTNLGKYAIPQRDALMGVILERLNREEQPREIVSKVVGCNGDTATRRLKKNSKDWPLGDLLKLLRHFGAYGFELSFTLGLDSDGNLNRETIKL